MARGPQNSYRFFGPAGTDLRHVTRRTIDPDGRESAEVFDLGLSAETDGPAESRVGNQSEISEVRCWKQIGVYFNEGPQDTLGHDLGAHRSVQKEIEVVRRPFGHLS